MPDLPIALVGCGAIAEAFYLPALEKRPDLLSSLILVDRNAEKAEAVRKRLGAAAFASDHREVLSRVKGAIVATPHNFNTPLTLDFVASGVNVLCEKPLSRTAAEVDQVVAAAAANRVHVLVNQTRRLYTSFQEVKRRITNGSIGELREIDYVLGEPFAWPAETNTYFGVAAGGRGVLFDSGAHIVDLVCWFLGGEPEIVSYEDDSRGGTEAVAEVRLRLGEANARIRLSWLSKLRNTYRITGTRGSIEGRVYESSSFTYRDPSGKSRRIKTDGAHEGSYFAGKLLDNFVGVLEGREQPIVAAGDVRPAISVIDRCYQRRSTMQEPWYDAAGILAHV
jgi:predicted dehydrogenase